MSSRDSRDLVAALIAFGENLRLLFRGPRPASPGARKYLQPAYRLWLGFVQKLSVRHVSNPLDSARQTFADQTRPIKVGSKDRLRRSGHRGKNTVSLL